MKTRQFQNLLLDMKLLKANHLVHIMQSWYGSRINAGFQQNLFSPEHNTGGKIGRER